MQGGGLRHISEFNPAFDPLHFVLMYPRGEARWCLGIPHGLYRTQIMAQEVIQDFGDIDARESTNDTGGKTVTVRDFMAFYLFTRSQTEEDEVK